MTNRSKGFRNPKANSNQKNINIKKTDSEETEPNFVKYVNEIAPKNIDYTSANLSRVPVEETFQETLRKFYQKWGILIKALVLIIPSIFAIANHYFEFENVKSNVTELKDRTKFNKDSIFEVEKKIIKIDEQLIHIKSTVTGLGKDSKQMKNDLKSIEIDHVRQTPLNVSDEPITPKPTAETK